MAFNESFPVCLRITARRDIEALKGSEKKLKGKYVIVVFKKTDIGFARILIVVSSKVGNAVMRNRLKRIVREVFRKDLKNIGSYDLMVIARKSAGKIDYSNLRDDLLFIANEMERLHK